MNVIIQAILLTALLTYAAIIDCKKREIPNTLCLGVSLLSLLNFDLGNLLGLGIALILWLTAVYIVPDKLGGGDIKLCAAVSIVIGFTATTYSIIIGFGIVSLVWLAMLLFKTKQEVEKYSLPLAPFLGLGFLITYFIEIGGRLV
ncbi:MAG TPA: prepilin peptidase [Ruminococcaceae bacterium]|jgi:leader peptidase (prepilin peptidase)/N-methyltransferase|nr:prepilin peptidase [Oscillospiraceae bacterium]